MFGWCRGGFYQQYVNNTDIFYKPAPSCPRGKDTVGQDINQSSEKQPGELNHGAECNQIFF